MKDLVIQSASNLFLFLSIRKKINQSITLKKNYNALTAPPYTFFNLYITFNCKRFLYSMFERLGNEKQRPQ